MPLKAAAKVSGVDDALSSTTLTGTMAIPGQRQDRHPLCRRAQEQIAFGTGPSSQQKKDDTTAAGPQDGSSRQVFPSPFSCSRLSSPGQGEPDHRRIDLLIHI
jgi:hypothetical protein